MLFLVLHVHRPAENASAPSFSETQEILRRFFLPAGMKQIIFESAQKFHLLVYHDV